MSNSSKKSPITILAIGDHADWDSYGKVHVERRAFERNGYEYLTTNYAHFLKGDIPQVRTDKIIIFFFFPFTYWNKYIEHDNYRGIYGNRYFYGKFVRFWERIERVMTKELRYKKVVLVNEPQASLLCRDKIHISKSLRAHRLDHPELHFNQSVRSIQKRLAQGEKLFLKPQFGSMGKGLTYLSPFVWKTNFMFRNSHIGSRKSDHGWHIRDVTGRYAFLRKILTKDIIVQKAVDPLILDGHIVDLRIYTFFNKAVYVYPRSNLPQLISMNISQGGKGDPSLLRSIPHATIERAKRQAIRASRALGLNLAGVDILLDQNLKRICVLDVNAFSGFPRRKTFNLPRAIAQEIKRLNHQNKLRFTLLR